MKKIKKIKTTEYYMRILNETLFPGDLRDLILTTISIDEYESKIDKNATVLAFFCVEENPAIDLSRYIEFGPIEVLDTEVSPAPDENGNYLVFVEIQSEDLKDLVKKVYNILEIVEHLVDNTEWVFQTRFGSDKIKII